MDKATYLRRLYHAFFMHYFFKIVYEQFMVKANGGTDDLGIKWKPLAQSTINRKYAKKYGKSNTKGRLTAQQTRLWRGIFFSYVKRGKSNAEAAQIAWGILKAKGALVGADPSFFQELLINVETEMLAKSLKPGKVLVRKAIYIPRPNQKAEVRDDGSFSIGSLVSYASEVNEVRPFLPDNYQRWVSQAKQLAQQEVKSRI